jgi:hypothetical protein
MGARIGGNHSSIAEFRRFGTANLARFGQLTRMHDPTASSPVRKIVCVPLSSTAPRRFVTVQWVELGASFSRTRQRDTVARTDLFELVTMS